MSYIGEYVPAPSGDPLAIVDEKTKLFRAVRSFPQLVELTHQEELPPGIELKQAHSPMRGNKAVTAGHVDHKRDKPFSLRSVRRSVKDSATAEITALNDFRKVLFASRRSNRPSASSAAATSSFHTSTVHSPTSPTTRVKEKIGRAALAYDPITDSVTLQAFDGRPLTRYEFKNQLKNSLNVNMSNDELDALLELLLQQQQQQQQQQDTVLRAEGAHGSKSHAEGDSQLVNGLDFHLLFFKLGEEFRQNVREYHKQVLQKEADAESRRRLLQKNRQQEWERKQISEFSQEDVDSALRKLATKAPGSNRDNFLDKINLQGFQCVMTPVQFKIQLQRSFAIELTPAELGGLCAHFDIDNNGSISGAEFIMRFTQLGYKQQQELREAQRRNNAKRQSRVNRYRPIENTLTGR